MPESGRLRIRLYTENVLVHPFADRSKGMMIWPTSNLSLAIDLEAAAPMVPDALASRATGQPMGVRDVG